MPRDFTLSLELHDYAIFYHWNYTHPVKNFGGAFGRVYPDGALFGISFRSLVKLGSGTHDVQLDETKPTPTGTKPTFDDEKQRLESFKTALFGYKHGCFTKTDLLKYALESFTETNSENVIKMAPQFLMQELIEHACRVPKILADRTPDSIDFFSSVGSTRIPDENLQLLCKKLATESGG